MPRETFGPGIFRAEDKTLEQIDKKHRKPSGEESDQWEAERRK
jgi:hypothetical protein